jgi:D-alanyl-D-alanine carboxypeptidase/D-alanyl-D-alanine-endopeptidase (penicillin-binding protein 4)
LQFGVLPNEEFVGAMFRNLWRELGGQIRGSVREGVVPFNATLLASIESPPLAMIVRDINKYSNNVMARQLYFTLGLEAGHRPARLSDAETVIRTWLAVKGTAFPRSGP